MGKFRRLFSAAGFGFAVAAIFSLLPIADGFAVAHLPKFHGDDSTIVLCPPSLLSVAFDSELGTKNFYAIWSVIGLMNAGLYATIRVLVSRRLQRPD